MSRSDIQQQLNLAIGQLQKRQVSQAKQTLESILQEAPYHLEALTHSLGIAYAQRDSDKVSEYQSRIGDTRCELSNPPLLIHLLTLLKNNHAIKTALLVTKRLLDTVPPSVELLHMAIDIAIEARANQEALDWLASRNSLVESSISLQFLKAKILSMQGRFEAAVGEYKNVLKQSREHSGAIAGIAKAVQFDEVTAARFCEEVDSIVDAQPDAQATARVLFAKAKALNDIKRYAEAWQTAVEANKYKLQTTRFEPQQFLNQVQALKALFTDSSIARHQSSNTAEHIFIVGMPRSGTTLVEQILSVVNDVYPGGETPAIEYAMQQAMAGRSYLQLLKLDDVIPVNDMATAYEYYFTQFSNYKGRTIVDKVPTNFFHIGLIKLMFPRAKIINMQRSSLDTAVSIFFENFSSLFAYTNDMHHIQVVQRAADELMAHWKTLFADDILDVQYESLVTDYSANTKRIGDFLSVELPSADTIRQSTNHVETPSIWQVRQPINTAAVERWRRYEHQLNDLNLEHLHE